MALDLKPEEWMLRLSRKHQSELPALQEFDNLFEMETEPAYMHPELLRELDGRVQQLILNWPRLVAEAIDERMDVEGFRYEKDASADADLWAMWQANNLDERSQEGQLDAFVMGRSFVTVGTRDDETDDNPLIAVESPLQMCADWDPKTRDLRALMRRWNETDPCTGVLREQYGTLLLPMETLQFEMKGAEWTVVDRDEHKLGRVPAGVLVNRGRTLRPGGASELVDIKPVAEAANKMATDMMISGEFHAMPRRWALGFDEEDFVDEAGNRVSMWKRIAGRIWATKRTRKEDGAEVGQFPEADLRNFHDTIMLLARLTSGLAALPPNYFGLAADDAASADAIRSREARLVKRAERRARAWGGTWEDVMRLALRFRDGEWDPRARSLETLWRNPATPTKAQQADATVKLVQAKIIPIEQGREDLGYTSAQRERMRRMDQDALTRMGLGDWASMTGPKPTTADEDADAGAELVVAVTGD